ncbi:MAG TPA: DUF3592 domain-containing protein [Beijerinckiaceae bacterium]|jgi:hypothetical protein
MQLGFVFAGISALVLLAGLLSIRIGRKNRKLAEASASWSSTTGKVIALSIAERERRTNDGAYTVYQPKIEYTYEVAGTAYAGQRLGFANSERTTMSAAQKLTAGYAVGQPVPVFYDPADPQSATLSTSTSGTRVSEIFGAVLAVAGLAGTLFGLYMAAAMTW